MIFSFDYYHNLVDVELYLHNPDGRELFPLIGVNRNLTLRFNDLSELTFDVYPTTTLASGKTINLESYDYLETKRLIFATGIGWFQITNVTETDTGIEKYKSISTESLQTAFKNKGVTTEERVYCFYNPADPYDDLYDYHTEDAIPSVVGQMKKQLGIQLGLNAVGPFDEWTITYISPSLKFNGKNDDNTICRTFKEETKFGYEWMVNTVEDAFEVAIIFDFMNKSIEVKTAQEITENKSKILYSHHNFMKNINVVEDSANIVTVLNCSGNNCDITNVNPTGTNYICDFSYYMDTKKNRWMSSELITKLNTWEKICSLQESHYQNNISNLMTHQMSKAYFETKLSETSMSLTELKNAQIKRGVVYGGNTSKTPGALCGTVLAETVKAGEKSLYDQSSYHSADFDPSSKAITAYYNQPTYNPDTLTYSFDSGNPSVRKTASEIIHSNNSAENQGGLTYTYFMDDAANKSYCVLKSSVDVETNEGSDPITNYYCSGFDRYIALAYPDVSNTGETIYKDSVQNWINIKENYVNYLNTQVQGVQKSIDLINKTLEDITSRTNLLNQFSNSPELLRELNQYWIEGDYVNENIAVLDNTTPEEAIKLTKELMATGYVELSKVCQPRYSFTLESEDISKNYEFIDQMNELELGKIITIEKEENLWYYPALLEINMSLDTADSFNMTFANAMRLDDWGFTYADLITDAASTSRKVNSSWQDLLKYAKDKETIEPLIKQPLDMTLRASFANMVNQEFTVDTNGILGRKRVAENSDEFEKEQVRLINNLLIFTDDNWETARAALGRIYYGEGQTQSAYGLIADTIIGTLMMSETLSIKNSNSTIQLDANGITIKKADGTEVFKAGTDGSLVVSNYVALGDYNAFKTTTESSITNINGEIELKASASELDALGTRVATTESQLSLIPGQISASVSSKLNAEDGDWTTFGWTINTNSFTIWNNSAAVFRASKEGVYVNGNGTFSGTIYAGGGSFGNWSITPDRFQFLDETHWTIFYPGGVDLYCDDGKYRHLTIGVGSPGAMQFGVTENGYLYANGATISGSLTTGTGSNIGGFVTDGDKMISTTTSYGTNDTYVRTTTIRPGLIRIEKTTTSTDGSWIKCASELSGGLIQTYVTSSYSIPANSEFMTVSMGGTVYGLYLDTTNMVVKIKRIPVVHV